MNYRFYFFLLLSHFFSVAQTTSITSFNTLIKPNHEIGLTNPLWNQGSLMTYDLGMVNANGAAFSLDFTNPGGTGFKGYPSGTIGGFKTGSTYNSGNLAVCGMPVQIQNLQHDVRIKWKVFQQNGNDVDDKWWATINVIFDTTDPSQQPITADRDFDLVIQLLSYEQDNFADKPNTNNGQYWYFARNTDTSLKTFDLYLDGVLYQWAVRYKFFDYPLGDPDYDKNNKVHIKFIPIDNANPIPNLDHSLKRFIDKGLEYKPFLPLTTQESILFDAKVATPSLWIKSISAGFEVYTGQFTIGNTYFYTLLDTTAPNAPLNLTANSTTSDVTLNWSPVIDDAFESYLIYRSTNNGPFELLSDEIRTTNYVDTTISTSNNYSYIVKAQDRSYNISNSSNQVDVNYISTALTPHQLVTKMGRGINVGNILSAPFEGNWAPAITENYIDDLYALRFKTVRIPIRFDNQTTPLSAVTYTDGGGNYIGSINDYSVNTSYLDRVEEVVDWCLNRNLIPIIDVHGDHWFWASFNASDPEYKTGNDRLAAIDRFKAIWRDISVRFQNKSDDLLFEIMNEPYFDMSAADVNMINPIILSIIRQTNPTRKVIVTGGGANSFNAPLQMSDAFILSDNYLIATFHYYRPFSFTSSSQPQHSDFDWGTNGDKNTVDNEFDIVQNWSQSKNIPIFLGEFGADNEGGYNYSTNNYGANGGPDVESRRLYHEYVANAGISRGFSIAAWDAGDKSNKTIYKVTDRQWVKDVRNAVLNATCISSGIIQNANVECNYDYNWTATYNNGAVGRLYNAYDYESLNNSVSLRLSVTTPGSTLNSVILSNDADVSNFIPNEKYDISCYAKGELGTETFRMRIKALVSGSYQYITSPVYNLSTSYQKYTYTITVPSNATELTFQIVNGLQAGSYFFDDFSMDIKDTCLSTTTWNGTTWNNGFPDATKQVVFNGDYTSSSDINACSVQIANNSTLTINPSNTLIVQNEVTVANGSSLVIENNAALQQINNSENTGNIIVKRSSAPMIRLDYTAWSSPVENQQLLAFSPNTLPNRFYVYNPSGTTSLTAYNSVDPNTNFEKGKGYIIRVSNNWSSSIYTPYQGQFNGVANNGRIFQNVSIGFNLIGNPYPSPINATTFLNNNPTIETLYFWTHEVPQNGAYTAQTNFASFTTLGGVAAIAGGESPNGFIQTGQGFYISNALNAIVNYENSQRTTSTLTNQFFRSNENGVSIGKYKLELTSTDNSFNQILIGYPENGTNKFDLGIDGKIFDDSKTSIYSLNENKKLVIQGRQFPFEETDVVKIGFRANQLDTYKIHLLDKEGTFINQKIYLVDLYLNRTIEISNTDYEFSSDKGIFNDRFEIRYTNSNIDNIEDEVLTVTYGLNNIIINSNKVITEIYIFDLLGRKIVSKKTNAKNESINFIQKESIYIIKVILDNGKTINKKLIIKNLN